MTYASDVCDKRQIELRSDVDRLIHYDVPQASEFGIQCHNALVRFLRTNAYELVQIFMPKILHLERIRFTDEVGTLCTKHRGMQRYIRNSRYTDLFSSMYVLVFSLFIESPWTMNVI